VTAIVATESLLLAVLILFVTALLRSHAEILRRLETLDPAAAVPRPESASGTRRAPDLAGGTPSGGARQIAPSGNLLLAFLSSGCSSCQRLIDSVPDCIAQLPASTRLVVVTKSPEVERVRRFRALEKLVDVVMTSRAWDEYAIPGSPYFVHVEDGVVVGEGSGTAWSQITSLFSDALDERETAGNRQHVDDVLRAAGIGPGHPSLHPARSADA
jgi:hypothetical protein